MKQLRNALIPEWLAESVDSPGRLTMRGIFDRVFIRLKTFLFCALSVPLLAVYLTSLVPPLYKAQTKVLIRNDGAGASFFNELSTPVRMTISGQSNAEIARSLPVCRNVIADLGLDDADIPKPAYKILMASLAKKTFTALDAARPALGGFIDVDGLMQGLSGDGKKNLLYLPNDFKESVEVKVLPKDKTETTVYDEIVEITAKSPAREKVASISNTLAKDFINEYFRLSEVEAQYAYDYLSDQARLAELADYKDASPSRKGESSSRSSDWSDRNLRSNPIVDKAAKQVVDLEVEVSRLERIYTSGSPRLERARSELSQARRALGSHENFETSKSLKSVLTDKKYQAFVTLQLYKNHLVPISIIEEASPPKHSKILFYGRYAAAGVAGLFVGSLFGFALVMFLGAVDPRLYTALDVEKAGASPVVGSIPAIGRLIRRVKGLELLPLKGARSAIMHVLGRLDLLGGGSGHVLVVTSSMAREGKTFVAVQTAATLAKDKRNKVLLVDANFCSPGLSAVFRQDGEEGMIELLKGSREAKDVVCPTSMENLWLIPAGKVDDRLELGFYKKGLRQVLAGLRREYDLIVIDAPGLLLSPDAQVLASEADKALMVVASGATKRGPLASALARLEQIEAHCIGSVVNFRRFPIPGFLYR